MGADASGLKASLRAAGRRVTAPRLLLVELIAAQEHHVDAHELHRLAQARDPRLSLATVYRTLALLRELGLVDELHLGEEHHHYEIRPADTHHHLVCAVCGRVIEFVTPLADALRAAVAQEHDFEITEARLDLVGTCASCRAARTARRP